MLPMSDAGKSVKQCLVLGASGFIGTNLCLALLRSGMAVFGFGRSAKPAFLPPEIGWRSGNFLDAGAVEAALAGIDCVFHLISNTVPASAQQDPVKDARENLLGTVQLLEACRRTGVKRVVFLSSGGTVYGPDVPTPTHEDVATHPISCYGTTKLSIEAYMGTYARAFGLSSVVLRLSNPYGPFQHARKNQGAVSIFLNRIENGDAIDIWGDGTIVRDYVYIEDVCQALVKAAYWDGHFDVINIGSGQGCSLNDLIAKIEGATGKKARVNYKPGRNVDVPVSVLDIGKAARLLKWQPQTELNAGIAKTLAWAQNWELSQISNQA